MNKGDEKSDEEEADGPTPVVEVEVEEPIDDEILQRISSLPSKSCITYV